jgi:hypothetical protein
MNAPPVTLESVIALLGAAASSVTDTGPASVEVAVHVWYAATTR